MTVTGPDADDPPAVATVDLRDMRHGGPASRDRFVADLGTSLIGTGFVKVTGHRVDPAVLDRTYRAAAEVFALPDPVKARYADGPAGGARGFLPFGRERARDATLVDLKEFWHVGREGGPIANVWPREVPDFALAARALFAQMEAEADALLVGLALHLGLPRRHLADLVVDADPLLRVLHYPPLDQTPIAGAVRAAAHEDVNFLTLLPAATDSGLELRDRAGRWRPVDAEDGELVVDSGDMLSRYLNGRIPATTHRVVNPADPAAHRYSLPFFSQPRPEVVLAPPPELRRPDEVVVGVVTAGEFHAQRMREIRGEP